MAHVSGGKVVRDWVNKQLPLQEALLDFFLSSMSSYGAWVPHLLLTVPPWIVFTALLFLFFVVVLRLTGGTRWIEGAQLGVGGV